jgi:hypothetical protein
VFPLVIIFLSLLPSEMCDSLDRAVHYHVLGLTCLQQRYENFIRGRVSINRSQMDVKSKTCDIRTWNKHLFIDISSTDIDILVPTLYQCVETRSHFRTSVSTSSSLAKRLPPRLNRFTEQKFSTINMKHLFMNILCIESFCPQKKHNRTLLFCSTILKHGRHFDY